MGIEAFGQARPLMVGDDNMQYKVARERPRCRGFAKSELRHPLPPPHPPPTSAKDRRLTQGGFLGRKRCVGEKAPTEGELDGTGMKRKSGKAEKINAINTGKINAINYDNVNQNRTENV